MSAVLLNVLIGLVTSVLSGGAVLTWRRVRDTRIMRRKAAFFGLRPGRTCLIVLNDHYDKPGSTSHNDVHTLIEIAALAHEASCPISVLPAGGLHESNGDRTEFCIGGPTSNPRTAGHLAVHLPGVSVRSFSAGRDPGIIIVGSAQFPFEHGRLEHALIAKFTPANSSAPVIVICGQRSIDNRAAINFLQREYRSLSRSVGSPDRFCLVVRMISSDTYGHQSAEVAADVTGAAFAARRVPSAATAVP